MSSRFGKKFLQLHSNLFYCYLENMSYKIKKILLAALTIIALGPIKAQISSDALLISEHAHFTTARSMGVGGAMGALGGDMS